MAIDPPGIMASVNVYDAHAARRQGGWIQHGALALRRRTSFMNNKHHKLVAAAVLASAIVTAGCSTEMFNQANNTLKTVQSAGKAVGDVRLPTAAIATALGGLELVQVLSKDSSAGIIAAGGGNIIAAGGMNFGVLQAAPASPSPTPPAIAFSGAEKTVEVNEHGVKAKVTYSSKLGNDNRSLISTIKEFSGDTNGYNIVVKGATFTYKINSGATKGGMTSFDLGEAGKLTKGDFALSIEKLTLNVEDPMPDNSSNIGKFVLTKTGGFKFDADLGVAANKIKATAKITEPGKDPKTVSFGEDNPNFTEEAATSAAQ